MKKYLASLVLFVLGLTTLVACGQKETNQSTSSQTWGETYSQLLTSGQEAAGADFVALQQVLVAQRESLGDVYLYVISPLTDGKASATGDADGDFMLTVDGSDPAEDWGVVYDAEAQFAEGWAGQVSAARSAWEDGDDKRWSAFAPIYNDQQEVVGLLGLDVLVTDLLNANPEWNRDAEEWNGYTHDLGEELPADLQAKVDDIKATVQEEAKKLNETVID